MRSTFMGVAALALASGPDPQVTAPMPQSTASGCTTRRTGRRAAFRSCCCMEAARRSTRRSGASFRFLRVTAASSLSKSRRTVARATATRRCVSTTSADDVATLLEELHVQQADVFGFSNGASIALQVAIRHPQAVRKLVFASSFTKKSGALPQLWEMIGSADFAGMPQGLKDAFLQGQPRSGAAPAHARQGSGADAALRGRAGRGLCARCASRRWCCSAIAT